MSLSRLLLSIAVVGLLAGCQTVGGWFSRDKDDAPAELVDFTQTRSVERIWTSNTGAGINRSRPAFRPVAFQGDLWVADHRGRIVAVDIESGSINRRFDTGLPLSAGPAMSPGLALVGTFDGQLVALNPEDGETRWTAQLSSEIIAYPVVQDGVVVVRSVDGRTFGLDVNSGRRLWVHDRSVPVLTLRGNSDPLVRAGQVFIGYDDGAVAALRVADGSLLWEQRVSEPEGRTELDRLADIDGPMAIVGSELYVATYRGRTASLALDAGRINWVTELPSASGLTVLRTQLAATDRDDAVWLLDRRDGSTLWRDDRLARRGVSRPQFVGDLLVVSDSLGFLHFYDTTSGEFAARVRASRNQPIADPLVLGNEVFLLDEDGNLSAWRLAN
ncbi:MAG: outer membrane protein assembly factor BamB [Wenzhouxiangella sp.]